jgi:hypothetical protein
MTTAAGEPTSSLYPTFERIGSDPRKYKVGFINRGGQQVIDPLFESARPFRCGLASVMQQKKWGAIDDQGGLRIQPVSDLPLRINEDRAIYEVNGRRGVMDLAGRIILEPKYRTIGEFREGVAWMSSGDFYGFISSNGEELIAPFYEDARSFSDGVAPVKLGGKWGFITKALQLEIPLQFDFALTFSEGLARVRQNELWGYISRNGEYLIQPQYQSARDFHEGLAGVEAVGKWGYIDRKGEMIIEPSFREAGDFIEGIGFASPAGHPHRHYGFIDRSGNFAISPRYEMVGTFRQGLCFVELPEELAYIDHLGSAVWRGPFVDVGRISEF